MSVSKATIRRRERARQARQAKTKVPQVSEGMLRARRLRDYLKSPEGQKKIGEIEQALRRVQASVLSTQAQVISIGNNDPLIRAKVAEIQSLASKF